MGFVIAFPFAYLIMVGSVMAYEGLIPKIGQHTAHKLMSYFQFMIVVIASYQMLKWMIM